MWPCFEGAYTAETVISFAVQDAIRLQLAHCDNGNLSFLMASGKKTKKTPTTNKQTNPKPHHSSLTENPQGVASLVLALT